MGGTVTVRSTVGVGTTFSLTLTHADLPASTHDASVDARLGTGFVA
jgi:hypothetical protein